MSDFTLEELKKALLDLPSVGMGTINDNTEESRLTAIYRHLKKYRLVTLSDTDENGIIGATLTDLGKARVKEFRKK